MQEIVQFLVDNWQPILSAFLSICAVIIVLIKKRPDANSLGHYMWNIALMVPSYINEAEKTGLTGSRKFTDVLGKCMRSLHQIIICSEDDDKTAKQFFTVVIEDILSTPQKKG